MTSAGSTSILAKESLQRRHLMMGGAAMAAGFARPARAQTLPVRIGVLSDESSYGASAGGMGAVLAARMAVADFGQPLLGQRVEVVHADSQSKPDIAAATVRAWFDQGVDAIVDLPATPVAAVATQIALEKNRLAIITAAASVEFTTKWCKPTTIMWQDDTHALAAGAALPAVRSGGKTWYFVTVDSAFGLSLEAQITKIVEDGGGHVLGAARYPQNNSDFSAHLLQAHTSGAQVIGFCCVAGDLVNAIKQAREFGIMAKHQITAFLIYITDIHALGPQTVQGLTFASSFYWNQNEVARGFADRFMAEHQARPGRSQAQVYAATSHFLQCVARAGTRDTMAIRRAMSALPPAYFGHEARVREDGRVLFDVTRYRVRAPADIHLPWDYYEAAGTLHPGEAFLPMDPKCKFF